MLTTSLHLLLCFAYIATFSIHLPLTRHPQPPPKKKERKPKSQFCRRDQMRMKEVTTCCKNFQLGLMWLKHMTGFCMFSETCHKHSGCNSRIWWHRKCKYFDQAAIC